MKNMPKKFASSKELYSVQNLKIIGDFGIVIPSQRDHISALQCWLQLEWCDLELHVMQYFHKNAFLTSQSLIMENHISYNNTIPQVQQVEKLKSTLLYRKTPPMPSRSHSCKIY